MPKLSEGSPPHVSLEAVRRRFLHKQDVNQKPSTGHTMDTPKVLSYRDTYVPVAGITRRHRRWKIAKLTLLLFVILLNVYFLLQFMSKPGAARETRQTRNHSSLCQHITPEPVVILQDMFHSSDYFFPHSYTERECVATKRAESKTRKEYYTKCYGDEYHCITRYEKMPILRIPFPGNVTSDKWKIETVHAAVACECSRIKDTETL